MEFVCPACKSELENADASYLCAACGRKFPVIRGIPDFRLESDPYIGLEADRERGLHLAEAGRSRTFAEMLNYYYSITPEDPADLAVHWTAHALAEVEIADRIVENLSGRRLLDVGCSTGGLLAAASRRFESVTGIDVAFRWLVIGQIRMRELGIAATLVCANAEYLPFPNDCFDAATCTDVLEHLADAQLALCEAARVAPKLLLVTNNRYAPLPDPQVKLWGVGLLPRPLQAIYVRMRRGDLHTYRVAMRGARELRQMLQRAGFDRVEVDAAELTAPHKPQLAGMLSLYNRVARLPAIRVLSRLAGPRLRGEAERKR